MRAHAWEQDSKREINQWGAAQVNSFKMAEPLPCPAGWRGLHQRTGHVYLHGLEQRRQEQGGRGPGPAQTYLQPL